MSIRDEATEVAAEIIEKGTEAAAHVAGEALECTCSGAKAVVEVVGTVASTVFGSVFRAFRG